MDYSVKASLVEWPTQKEKTWDSELKATILGQRLVKHPCYSYRAGRDKSAAFSTWPSHLAYHRELDQINKLRVQAQDT